MAKRRPLPEERPVRLAAARCRRARRDVEPLGVPLTGRQREMLALIADGLTRAAIARRLGLAEDTVEHYVTAIRERLGVHSTPAAVAAGFRLGLLGDGPAPPDPLLAAKAAAYDRV
ncbi:MAG TPA: helix-turn-helix transcriptional regulator, partial [Thermomicrobiales bacterium]|nr:helix-turn-helix transcriptional regulator [Thermomicrobiales bacterium]